VTKGLDLESAQGFFTRKEDKTVKEKKGEGSEGKHPPETIRRAQAVSGCTTPFFVLGAIYRLATCISEQQNINEICLGRLSLHVARLNC
jgi:hypothetical protein